MYQDDYNFKRLAHQGETRWEQVVDRFINEIVKRGGKTTREDLEWLCRQFIGLPNSPALLTAGTKKFYASACSSYPIDDTFDGTPFSILGSLSVGVLATKAGIGTGWNFSRLRSKEEPVGLSDEDKRASVLGSGGRKVSGGPVGFLKSYSGFLSPITQATRKSASMGLLHVSHPDILDYINCKQIDGAIAGFNLSVLLDDEFMRAAVEDKPYNLKYITLNQNKEVKARDILDLIAQRAWENGEPAVMFEDTIKRDHFEPIGTILANPCAEAIITCGDDWLELCVLGSLNLSRYSKLSESDRKKAIRIMVEMLNDIIDVQDYVSEYHRKGMKERNRKIGIGVAGLATQLAVLGIKYSSQQAKQYTQKLFKEIGEFAQEASAKLGDLRGIGRHNGSLISVAPTSTLSNIFNDMNEEGCSYGLEPYFSLEPIQIKNSFGVYVKQDKIVEFLKGSTGHIECANDLDWKSHVGILEAYYSANPPGITQGASKTLNFKNNVSVNDIRDAVIYCWQHGVKAISFYRDGSRKDQVLTAQSSVQKDRDGLPLDVVESLAPKRPETLPCKIYRVQCEKKKWLVFVSTLNGKPFEIFAGLESKVSIPKKMRDGKILRVQTDIIENGKAKKRYDLIVGEGEDQLTITDIPEMFENKQYASLTRMASMSLRHGAPVRCVVEQLFKDGALDAFQKAVARTLKGYIPENESTRMKCERCESTMIYVSGCPTCRCGFSKCG